MKYAGMILRLERISLLVGRIGIIFGLYPAARAAALDPIIALRHE